MHADHVAFAERSDFQLGSGGVLNNSLQRHRRSRRRVFLLGVMALEDLSGILVLQSGGGGARNVEKQIYSDGKICGVEKPTSALFHHLPDSRQFAIPAGSADDHVLPGADASLNVPKNRGRSGEIDNHIDRSQPLRPSGGGVRIVGGAQHGYLMAALACHFRHQRAVLPRPRIRMFIEASLSAHSAAVLSGPQRFKVLFTQTPLDPDPKKMSCAAAGSLAALRPLRSRKSD